MKKLNFATRVSVAVLQRGDSTGSAVNERNRLNAEVNSRPVKIDKSVFQKTEHEKEELKIEKAHWKKKLKARELFT
jgi:hypothetical protein